MLTRLTPLEPKETPEGIQQMQNHVHQSQHGAFSLTNPTSPAAQNGTIHGRDSERLRVQ
jgi:hypothetical protein